MINSANTQTLPGICLNLCGHIPRLTDLWKQHLTHHILRLFILPCNTFLQAAVRYSRFHINTNHIRILSAKQHFKFHLYSSN
jgi:hypothetical protein